MSKSFVAILMGSESDLSTMQAGADILKQLEIDFEIISNSSRKLKFNFLGKFKKDTFKWL